MAYALVGSAGAVVAGSGGGSSSPLFGQATTLNNLLILWVATGGINETLPTTPAGWTIAKQKSGTNTAGATASIYYKIAAGGDTAPVIAGIAGDVISAQLAEFSGNVTSSPVDQIGAGVSVITSPITDTNASADTASGELLIGCCGMRYSVLGTKTITATMNNATATTVTSAANSIPNHYIFGYGITTSNGSADNYATTYTTTNINDAAEVVSSFLVLGAASPAGVPFAAITNRMPM